jgi:hypothetical protein
LITNSKVLVPPGRLPSFGFQEIYFSEIVENFRGVWDTTIEHGFKCNNRGEFNEFIHPPCFALVWI